MYLGNSKLKVRKAKHAMLYTFWCPGCQETHTYQVLTPEAEKEANESAQPFYNRFGVLQKPNIENWTFNGDFENPTFSPSLHYNTKVKRCHLFLKNGVIEYCGDSWHQYSGQNVPLEDF